MGCPSRRSLRSALDSALTVIVLLLPDAASAQTRSQCNPLNTQCPTDPALGMSINVDFRKGAVNSFAASGTPSYGADGVSFTVSRGGDAPQLNSLFYIMFGYVELTLKAAPGAGIVSSLVLESDDLDEIDMEWLGSNPDEMQSNYFGKGRTTVYNRGQFHAVRGTQDGWITYAVDWSRERIDWFAGGIKVRSLGQADAAEGQYPQTPMRIKFGSWAGGDPAHNQPGTVSWARGPFSMQFQSLRVVDYSTGKEYRYQDQSGSWTKIEAVGGAVNGNQKDHAALSVPGGIARDGSPAARTQTGWPWVAGASPTGGTIHSGWHMTSEGKIMRDLPGSAAGRASPSLLLLLPLLTALACAGLRWPQKQP